MTIAAEITNGGIQKVLHGEAVSRLRVRGWAGSASGAKDGGGEEHPGRSGGMGRGSGAE